MTRQVPAPLMLGRGGAVTADVLQPGDAVEFCVDRLDLPGVCLTLGVFGLEDGNALDSVWRDGGVPSEGNGVTSDSVNGHQVEWDRWLSALTGFESSLVGEGGLTQGLTSQLVDAVRPINEVVRQKLLCGSGAVVGEEATETSDEVLGRTSVQAFARVHPVDPARSSRGRGEQGSSGERNE